MSLWEILVPRGEADTDTLHQHQRFDEEVRRVSGGMTIFRRVLGEWHGLREQMLPVRFIASKEEAESVAHFAKKHYNQEAILFYKISDEVYEI